MPRSSPVSVTTSRPNRFCWYASGIISWILPSASLRPGQCVELFREDVEPLGPADNFRQRGKAGKTDVWRGLVPQ